jgi:hypothetical protein
MTYEPILLTRLMRYGRQARAALVLFAALRVPACGGESPSLPTASCSQTTVVVSGSGFGGSGSVCQEFINAKAGGVTVLGADVQIPRRLVSYCYPRETRDVWVGVGPLRISAMLKQLVQAARGTDRLISNVFV